MNDFSHIRPLMGEPRSDYFARVVEQWALADDGRRRGGRIRTVLRTLEREAAEQGQADAERKLREAHDRELEALRKRIEELDLFRRHSVTKSDAEAGRQQAALNMRNRAAALFEGDEGETTPRSNAIDELPLPKPIWTTTVRPS